MSELRAAAERVRLDGEPGERWGATAAGLAIVVLALGRRRVVEQELPDGRRHRAVPGRAAGVASARPPGSRSWRVASVLLSADLERQRGRRRLLRPRRRRDRRRRDRRRSPRAGATRAAQRRGDRRAAHRRALQPRRGGASSRTRSTASLYANDAAAETLGYASAEVLLTHAARGARRRRGLLHRGRLAAAPERVPTARVLRGEEPGPVTIRVVNRSTGEERWRVTKARGVNDGRGRPRLVVSVIEDITERKRSELAQRVLVAHRRGAGLVGRLRADAQGGRRPRRARARRLVRRQHARPAGRHPPGRGRPQRPGQGRVRARLRPPLPDAHQRRGRLRAGPARRAGPADPGDPGRAARAGGRGPRAARADPRPGHALGGHGADGRRHGPADGRHLVRQRGVGRACSPRPTSRCSRRSGAARASRSRTRGSTSERSTIARTLQRALLPPALPEIPGYSLATLYRPAGGRTGSAATSTTRSRSHGGWMVVVGDVAGRGAPAASLTAYSRHVLRTSAQLHEDPLDAIAFLNRQLYERPGPALCTRLLRAAARARRRRGGDGDLRGPPAALRDPRATAAPSRSGGSARCSARGRRREFPRTKTTLARRRAARALHRRRAPTPSASTSASATAPAATLATRASPRRRCAGSRRRWSSSSRRAGRRHCGAGDRPRCRRSARLGRVDLQALGGALGAEAPAALELHVAPRRARARPRRRAPRPAAASATRAAMLTSTPK